MKSRLKRGAAVTVVAIALVGGFEGLRTVAYRDPVGIPTVCFGETGGVHMGDHYTVAECKAMLGDRLVEMERGMAACLDHPDAIPNETYAAFLSFTYNVGTGAFCRSTLAHKANAGDLAGACDELLKWTRAGSVVLPGLVKRRQQERALCRKGLSG
jgi:lysozyme